MPTVYEKVVSIIEKPVENRTDFDCQELLSWFRNKSSLFRNLKPEIVKDVIRHCIFERKQLDDVIIKQGDSGDRLYIILRGKLSIYVIQDKENEQELRQNIEKVCAKPKLERQQLGQHVWTCVEGQSVGEIALIKEDCIRTASVVVDERTDLMVVDRALYNRSVRDALEKDFNDKTAFVERNPLFKYFSPKMKKSLVISLKNETQLYGSPIVRQGHRVHNLFFLLNGEAEITIDQGSHKSQFPELWAEMLHLLPELLPRITKQPLITMRRDLRRAATARDQGVNYSPIESLRRKRMNHKNFQMCLLGANEILGAIEMLLGLKTYMETATVTRKSDILSLSVGNYIRLFTKKSSSHAIDMMKDMMTSRLYLYIHRTEMSFSQASLLKFLTLKLKDTDSLKTLQSRHRKKKPTNHAQEREYFYGSFNSRRYGKDEENIIGFLKTMGIYYMSENSLPEVETSTRVLNDLDSRMSDYVTRTKSFHRSLSPLQTNGNRSKRYKLEAFMDPPTLHSVLRSKTTL